MAAPKKITLSSSRDIPFDKLVLSDANVRRIKAGVSIEELAEDIARRTLLQSLTVRPIRDAAGQETGMFEIPAGGRRYRALELLVKQKRLAKTAPIPCIVREDGLAEEDSLAENIQRAPLHPLDQFRAFMTFREKGMSEEEIAAAQFVSVAVVRQRLRLAAISPKLLDVYAADGMTLDQLMAFTVNGDHERQEQVFERLANSYSKEPHVIRRMLTEEAVRASDKRAQFVGPDAYASAGGTVMRDLFQGDDGGWLQDAGLLERLLAEKLAQSAEAVVAEGWKWVEVAPDFPYGHTYGLRQLRGERPVPTPEEQAVRDRLQAEIDQLEETHAGADELPEEIDARLGEIEAALAAFDDRPAVFLPEDIARAGAFVSIDGAGKLRVERGYVRPEDEAPVEQGADEAQAEDLADSDPSAEHGAGTEPPSDDAEEEDGLKPLPDRLMMELTAYRTLALRHALGEQPDVAFLAALHALALRVFYHYGTYSCLELDLKSAGFGSLAPGLNDSALAQAIDARHQAWVAALPRDPADLWSALEDFDGDSREALFAHCVSLSVNAVHEPYNRRPRALAHAGEIAGAVDLDLAASGWQATVENYLGRVTKARILAAVKEARGPKASGRLAHLKKGEMAMQAQNLLAGTGWLPEPLRTSRRVAVAATAPEGDETAMATADAPSDDDASAVAAE